MHVLHGLQASPTSEDKDLDILQLPPADDSLLGPEAPFERSTYVGAIMFGSRMVLPAGLGLSTGPQECAAPWDIQVWILLVREDEAGLQLYHAKLQCRLLP